jgi:hypothetical protein
MRTKTKLTLIIVISVLALLIIGLTLGLVFTADTTTVNNTLTVAYDVDDVECTIALSGKNIDGNTDEDLTFNDDYDSISKSITFTKDSVSNNSVGSFEFNETEIKSAYGYIQYIFTITNNSASSTTQDLKVQFSLSDVTETSTNMNISVNESDASDTDEIVFKNDIGEIDYSKTVDYIVPANTGTSKNSKTFIITFKADKLLYDASFEGVINLKISYLVEANA